MNILQNFKFLDGATTVSESNVLSNPNKGSQLVLQVDSVGATFSLTVMGKVDAESENYTALSTMSVTDYTIDSAITSNGIYSISTDGISGIYVDLTSVSGGSVSVFGKLGE